jgi:Tfp pilus assembly protein PilF
MTGASQGERDRAFRRRGALAAAALFALVAGVYAPSLRFGFIYDDPVLFARTPVARTGAAWMEILREPHFSHLPYWRPVARATFELQKLVHGARPGLFHLANALGAGLLALAARALLRRPGLCVRERFAWLGAALLALHPVASSTVYPPTGRETLLASTLTFAALALFLRGGRVASVAAVAAFALALGCHEQAIVLPALAALADLCGLCERRAATPLRRVLRHAPFALVALVFLAARARVLGAAGGAELALLERPLGPLLSVVYALVEIFAPRPGLAYEAPLEVWASAPRLAVTGVLLLALAALVLRERRRIAPVPAFGAGVLALAHQPPANVVVQQTAYAERWVCLASLAPAALVAALASAATPRASRAWTAGLALLAAALGALSYGRGLDHADARTFLERWLATNPRSAQAHGSLGALLFEQGDRGGAERHLRRAVELEQGYADAHGNLGALLLEEGRLAEALPHLRMAVRLQNREARYQFNLGLALVQNGNLDGARHHLRRALELRPDFAAARLQLAEVERRLAAAGGG